MMTASTVLLENAVLSAGCLFCLWLASLRLRDVSFVDSWWAFGIVMLAAATHFEARDASPRGLMLLALSAAWCLRLGLYLLWRWRTQGEDARYAAILRSAAARRGWSFAMTSGLQVFALQGILQFVVALPVQLGQIGNGDAGPGPLALAGAALALAGIAIESIGDFQLVRFRRDPDNQGRVLDTGLWRYTRHPNYFGNACAGWGLFLVAAEAPLGLWSLPAPILLTILLTRVSGVPMLEHGLMRRRPGYGDYVARTSAFIPWRPRRRAPSRAR